MARLQSSIGLVTGTDIVGTVDQLMAINAQPRDRILAKTEELLGQQQQIASLTASVIGVQLAGDALGSSALFSSKNATSSNEDALSVSTRDEVTNGNHLVRTLRTAATHSVSSAQSFSSFDEALSLAGSLTIKPSGFVDSKVSLSQLNNGLGVEGGSIRLTDRSGASAEVDLSQARTVDDVLQAINDADVGIQATTSGGKIKLIDQTGQSISNLKVEQLGTAETAADLGLHGIDVAASSVDGNDIPLPDGVDSLNGASLSQLGGGNGLGTLTSLDIQTGDGTSASIDVSGATSLNEVIDAINGSGLDVIARINDAGNGLRIRDVSGGPGTFEISSADDTATSLGIAASTTDDIVVGEDLNFQSVTLETKLSELNSGDGVGTGSFTIRDSNGAVGGINLAVSEIETIGDLIEAVNALDIGVEAALNEAGDGVVITDTAGGASSLKITDTGEGKVAASLGLAGTADAGTSLVGSESVTIEITEDDTLESIVEKINESDRYADASVVSNSDGSYSLQIRSKKGGEVGRISVNLDGVDLNLRTNSKGQDALISIATDGGTERFLTSTDGVFEDEISGLNLTVKELSEDPITVNVDDDPDAIVSAVKRFADQYNKLIDNIQEVTFFDAEANEVGLLFGSTETLRIQNGYSRLLTGTVPLSSGDSIRSFSQIGVRMDENGELQVDETKLKAALANDTEAVEQFFNKTNDEDENIGMVGQLKKLADTYAGVDGGMLIRKTQTLSAHIERNDARVESMNDLLESQRERLLKQYYDMEQAIAKLQANTSSIGAIEYIGPVGSE
ncbi:flagellar hook-associated 2 domain protein [Rhodopirellula baltica SH28]|uniref:Flagellar hook-associated protein 2 n=1 Tax=Rhodopirellula baltica SH28 TaxID=993517 RepID=K5EDL4_RHOBT|nr:flagellar filament capping protein FliD [Rhodopirellula baltica]EKK03981.1 flagellar hook-associated 2 domain protein [Rhodopirellula baltica SH28]